MITLIRKMRALLLLTLTVVFADAAWHGWKPGVLYEYELRSRIVSGFHLVSDQYTGILLKAKVIVQPYGENTLNINVQHSQCAEIHTNLSSGWSTHISDGTVSYKPLPLANKLFELKLKNGLINKMVVEKSISTWELNMLKGIASQLQIDTQAENVMKSRINSESSDGNHVLGHFKTMEDAVDGMCETLYDVSHLSEYEIQSKPILAPLHKFQDDDQIISIIKTRNYSNCHRHPGYYFGLANWKLSSSPMNNIVSRASVQRMVLSGSLDSYVIQSSVTTNTIITAPHLYSNQKGIVVSRVNMTLEKISTPFKQPQRLSFPKELKDLVYEYNGDSHDKLRLKQKETSSSSSSSEDSSCSDNEYNSNIEKHTTFKRTRRSVNLSRSSQLMHHERSGSSNEIYFGRLSSSLTTSSSGNHNKEHSSSSRNNKEKYFQPKPSNYLPPQTPFLPFFAGFKGNSIQASDHINGTKDSINLARKIASELQNPNEITGKHTLTTFSILTRVIQTMTVNQIREAGEILFDLHSRVDSRREMVELRYLTWVAFRDAVAQAGTSPALVTITHWIREHKVEGEEAAQLLSVLPNTVKYPNEKYLNFVFALISNPLITEQEYLNTTAVNMFTILLDSVQKDEQLKRFPVHSFGQFSNKQLYQRINKEYLPYLKEQLNISVIERDSHKIQVYIRAIGNIGHPRILHLLEPYLEGKRNISNFQRLMIVVALDRLAQKHPKTAQHVFYRIYKNSEEATELRVAAVMQLMKTNPSAQMLQRMAQFTNYEHNKQVNSAVKSAIESAAKLTGSHNRQLAENARSAVNLLTEWEYGYQYSKQYLKDYTTENMINSLKWENIQSEDSVIPSSMSFILDKTVGGLMHPSNRLTLMTSSINDLLNLLRNQFTKSSSAEDKDHTFKSQKFKSNSESQWSIEKIFKLLNISFDEADQVEGNFRFSWFGVDRFLTFDNRTIEQIPRIIRDSASSLRHGKSFNYTKLMDQKTITLAFPSAMGLPFVYSLEEPTLISIGGESRLKTTPDLSNNLKDRITVPETLNLTTEIKITYASKTQSKLGVVTPFNHHHYFAGYDSGLHIHLPLRVQINADIENLKVGAELEPLDSNSYQKVAEYSTLAYTTIHNVLDLSPPQINENVQPITTTSAQKLKSTFGQDITGFAFDLNMESEQNLFDYTYFIGGLRRKDIISVILNYNKDQLIKPNTNFTLTFNPEKTTAETFKINVNYDGKSMTGNDIRNHPGINSAVPLSPEKSHSRSKQFLSAVSSGSKDGNAETIDISLEFLGNQNIQYIVTGAYGRSPTSSKSQILLFLSKRHFKQTGENQHYEIAIDLTSDFPKVPLVHYRKAVDADPSSSITALINFGENLESSHKIIIKSKLEQSQKFLESLEMDPTAYECERQMLKGNNILPACRNVTARANLLDKYSISVRHSTLPEGFKNTTYKIYSALREIFYDKITEEFNLKDNEGQVNLDISFSPDLTNVNASITSPVIRARFTNLEIGENARAIAVIHPEYNLAQRLGQITMRSQQYPTCVIDKSSITTFDNRTYDFHLGKCWHVMLLTNPRYQQDSSMDSIRFSILTHDVAPNQREVMLVLDKDVLTLEPYSGTASDYFMVNGEKILLDKNGSKRFNDKNGDTVVQAFILPSGELRMISPKYEFDIIYDGLRIKFQISNRYRNQIRGLCGDFNGEKATDFKTPKNCMVQKSTELISSYALLCDEMEQEKHKLNLTDKCILRTIKPTDAILYNNNAVQRRIENIIINNKVHKKGYYLSCGALRTLVIFREGQKCFSKVPQLTCMRSCLETVPRAQRKIEFSCLPLNEVGLSRVFPATLPNLLKAVNVTESVWVPLEC